MSTTPPEPPPTTPGPPPATTPGPPPGPPSGPPSATPPAPPSAGRKKKGGRFFVVGFIVATVLFVGALVFAIVGWVGKSDESDKKQQAQEQLASTQEELADVEAQLGGAEQAGETLSDLLTQAASAADDLKACTDSSSNLREGMIEALNALQGGGDINDRVDALNQQIDDNRNSCSTSDEAYQELVNALTEAGGE